MAEFQEKDILSRLERLSQVEPDPQTTSRVIEHLRHTLTTRATPQTKASAGLLRAIIKNRPTKLAAAAGIMLLVGLGLVSLIVSGRSEPASRVERVAQLRHAVMQEGAAAQMLAVADLLAGQPGGKEYARERYSEIIRTYQNTEYAEQARLRLRSL
jgi:hypothetical protein